MVSKKHSIATQKLIDPLAITSCATDLTVEKKLFAPPQNQLRSNLDEEESSQEFVQLQSINNTDESEAEKEPSLKASKSSEQKPNVEKHANSTLRLTNGELWGRDFSDVCKI